MVKGLLVLMQINVRFFLSSLNMMAGAGPILTFEVLADSSQAALQQ